jgi:hypothetical protein
VSQFIGAKGGEFMYRACIGQADLSAGLAEENPDSAGPETAIMGTLRWVAKSNINLGFASELRD